MGYVTEITTIVPRLTPAIDGVGDYGLHLAQQMRQDFGLITQFVVADPHWSGASVIEDFSVKQLQKQSSHSLQELLPKQSNSCSIVLLHYVGYGYAKRGCPIWLVRGLESWSRGGKNRYLVTMFHELYAFGSIWTSQYWTSSLQKKLAARLVILSDRCLTSNQEYAGIIQKFSLGKHPENPILPIFSNVGEPENPPPLEERQRRLVVFGSRGSRERVYQRSRIVVLERICRELEITEIWDIGPAIDLQIESINGIPIICQGILTASQVSSVLANSTVGFFDYYLECLAKSGIFAAYCAHRLIPVGVWYEARDVDGLQVDHHYWLGDKYAQKMNLSAGQTIADNAYSWYKNHRLIVHAQTFITHLHRYLNR